MAITAKCSCGKRTSVADSLAGRTITCSACGRDLLIAGAPSLGPSAAALKAQRQKAAAGSAVSINPMIVISAVVGVIVFGIVLALYLGPWRVGSNWAAMSKQANNDVTDVINYSIQAYESEQGMYDPRQSHITPHIEGDATFMTPYMAFTMPRRIPFFGATNQGAYKGTYDTTTGEVIADVDVGGMTVGGLVQVQKSTGSFHLTGREKNGKVTAEGDDGHSLQIIMKKLPDEK
jgi:hypothetical protein